MTAQSPRKATAAPTRRIRWLLAVALAVQALAGPAGCTRAALSPGDVATVDLVHPLRPRPVPGGWLFSFKAPPGTRSVHLAGEFNNWSLTAWPMSDPEGDGIWTITAPLEPERRYEYKYVVDGSRWVTDPDAEATDPNNYYNAIVITRRPGEAYLFDVVPSDGARLTSVPSFSARLERAGRRLRSVRGEISDGLGRQSWPVTPTFDPRTASLSAVLPPDLADGDYRLSLTVEMDGASPITRTIDFSLDRSTGDVDSPEFYDHAVIYEIYLRSFRDGRGNDGIGDFEGLINSLDYLNDGNPDTHDDLGVDVLWLMPIHPSPSEHGYDITDYEGIKTDYGNLEDYRRFVAEAHRRGMRVLLDYVVNHTSNRHPFFLDAYRNPASPYSAWYQFTDPGNGNYEGFAGIREMPQLNFRCSPMRDYLIQVARFWIDLDQDGVLTHGVDGFRCDVAKGPPHSWWKELRSATKSWRSDFLLLGEVWDSARTIAPYFHGEFDMNFDYPLYYTTLDLLNGTKTPSDFVREYQEERDQYPAGAQLCRFLDNHDNNRIASLLKGDERRIRLATGLLLTWPGTPLIYYGTEVGMQGVKPDPDIRKPMRWDLAGAQTGDPTSLLSWHRDLIQLRHEEPALSARDDVKVRSFFPAVSTDTQVLAYERRVPGTPRAWIVAANMSPDHRQCLVTLAGGESLTRGESREWKGGRFAAGSDPCDLVKGLSLDLDPYEIRFFELRGS